MYMGLCLYVIKLPTRKTIKKKKSKKEIKRDKLYVKLFYYTTMT